MVWMKEMPLAAFVLAWREAADLRAHLLRDGQSRGVVARARDPASRRELLHVLVEGLVVQLQLSIREDRAHVVIDDHVILPDKKTPSRASMPGVLEWPCHRHGAHGRCFEPLAGHFSSSDFP